MLEPTTLLAQQLDALLYEETNPVTNFANASALLMDTLPDLNWAGFYLYQEAADRLDLGPFQGHVACMHIENGSGVCGTALKTQELQRVEDVHAFPGHIACDSASNSELVIPLTAANGKKLGVIDLDSPTIGRFTEEDAEALTEFAAVFVNHVDSVA